MKQVEVDHAPDFGTVFGEVMKLYRRWNIRQTFVFGNADKPVFLDNLRLYQGGDELERIGESMRDLSQSLFFTLLKKKVACLWKKQAGYWTCLWTERFTMR